MRPLLPALAVLGLAGTLGTANAAPIVATSTLIWNAMTPGDPSGTGPEQKALPGNPIMIPGNLVPITAGGTGGINFDQPSGGSMIADFLNTGAPGYTYTCAACATTIISQSGFAQVSLFEFKFTAASNGTLNIEHDDGVSLFKDGDTITDLLPVSDADPTVETPSSVSLTGGQVYDLFYAEDNGLPAVLTTDFVAVATPEPASLTLLGAALIGFGWIVRRRRLDT
ncbi:MAG: PEP-CTERM sorting domain-containing protein [Stellaceae bacterium]